MSSLVIKRGQIKGQVKRFANYVENLKSEPFTDTIVANLQTRLNKIELCLDEFNEIQNEIEVNEKDASKFDAHTAERLQFEDDFYSVIAIAKTTIENYQRTKGDASVVTVTESNDGSKPMGVKLPTINLPSFSGNYENWLEFHDTFNSLIHMNKAISDIQKFHYLRSCLKNEAAAVIQSLEASAASYPIAWQLLRERFHNKRLMVNNHVKALFNLNSSEKESITALRYLLDETLKYLRSLKALKQPTESWDTLLIYMLSSKFDSVTRREWESFKIKDELPSFEEFTSFLRERCNILEALKLDETSNRNNKNASNKFNKKISNNYFVRSNNLSCTICKGSHLIYNCKEFLRLPVKSRLTEAKKHNLCVNCLRKGHDASRCNGSTCRKCHKRHNTLIHIEQQQPLTTLKTDFSACEPETSVTHVSANYCTQVLLSTACVKIYDKRGQVHNCRVLLDSGSQSNFITENMCNLLDSIKSPIKLSVTGISSTNLPLKYETSIKIASHCNSFQTALSCLVINKITELLPNFTFDPKQLSIPKNLRLADPEFYKANQIDMLIGSSIFWQLLSIGQIRLGKGRPILQKTQLGWVVVGNIPVQSYTTATSAHCCTKLLEAQVNKFWSIEDFESTPISKEEEICEKLFISTTERTPEGRFIVKIPFLHDISELGDSRQIATKRFYSMERKLQRQPELSVHYKQFMDEYEDLGHMTAVPVPDTSDSVKFYLPHHAVLREESTTTKVRVVFDGSSKSTSGVAINDIQAIEPALQQDLFSILLRFRTYQFVLAADITKMYRQILIHESQRDLQRIIWRRNPTEALKIYTLNTVTYGTSAPFLAMRCLKQLAIDHKESHPRAHEIILNDFYVDDLLTGANTKEEIIHIYQDVSTILQTGLFELRKWTSNCTDVLDVISKNGSADTEQKIRLCEESKTLGILWIPSSDTLEYSIIEFPRQRATKRVILSVIAQIYDPLGLISPVTITAKIILQHLWQAKLSWDESIPIECYKSWNLFMMQLPLLNNLKIKRQATFEIPSAVELHAFCDASESAYGACIYLRNVKSTGSIITNLLCAKSKVAPIKTLSLPRLELAGALLLTKLVDKVRKSLNLNIECCYYWCDSTIVLSWIRMPPQKWKTFVANRVATIQNLTTIENWRHVRSHQNPADLISRGVSANTLENLSLWWAGPSWLQKSVSEWPVNEPIKFSAELPESRKIVALHNFSNSFDVFERYLSFSKLQRVVAYMLRFKHNVRSSKNDRIFGCLTVEELNQALTLILKLTQLQSFQRDYEELKRNGAVRTSSKLLSLQPFLDTNHIIRVGGRLTQSSYSFSKKHPAILPSNHRVTDLLINQHHERLLHGGPQAVLASLRDHYWPLSARNAVRKIIRRCVTCFRAAPRDTQQLMGNLPETRLTPSRPFSTCGVDYAGPFLIKDRKTRGAKLIKSYICLFVCFATKAIHLELVGDLTTQSFLCALRRFTARRGKCIQIYSDNGTNFVGAKKEINDLHQLILNEGSVIKENLTQDGITWHFIPPNSPHFGGLWEAGVRSTKFHLKRIMKNANLSYEAFYTVLVQIEACLNSRPLSPLSSDPNDLNSLTPAHFLIGENLTTIPDPSVLHIPESRLDLYQKLQQLQQHFWRRWSKEYISELQQRVRWKTTCQQSLKPGTMVLVKEDNLPPLYWKLSRITHVHPGDDHLVRVVTIRTASGVYKRSVAKICMLPIES